MVDVIYPIVLAGMFSLERHSLVNTSIFLIPTFLTFPSELCLQANGAVIPAFLLQRKQ